MTPLNNDQRRESVNTSQRFEAWQDAKQRLDGYRGSLVWHTIRGEDHLVRSYYDASGKRRQTSEGKRDPKTEAVKFEWDGGRDGARIRFQDARDFLARQAAINRALDLGRLPDLAARILRALDETNLLGRGLRVVGTNAIYAYEAVSGVKIEAEIATTSDIDLLLDSRRNLRLTTVGDVTDTTLIALLRRVDRSFERSRRTFQAVNRDGYVVDLIKPLRRSPWRPERETVGVGPNELEATSIAGLAWHESAPPFTATVIDERGMPVRMVASDPRVFAAHKLWLSRRADRDPTKRERDAAQARAVAHLVVRYLRHLPYRSEDLRMLPRDVVEAARPLFESVAPDEGSD